jgi:hypothetical protein
MSTDDWTAAYRDAWKAFYSFEHMKTALLRQNPHTYWGMFKCFVWYRASMIEGTHPMVTGFFRLKDRLSRRSTFPIEGRWQFFRRRLRETATILVAYGRLMQEMQELWLQTRIRREEYAWVGDLKALKTRAAAVLDVKTSWSRLHAALALRMHELKASAGAPAHRFSTIATERFEAIRNAMGNRAEELAKAAGATWHSLRVPSLPPLRPRSALRRLAARLNIFHAPTPEKRRALSEYWERTERHLRRGQVWRLNPITFSWNAARDLKNALIFVTVMTNERH